MRPLLLVAGAVAALLAAFSGRYGPHRDELYFVAAGKRLAWGYPDQGPLTPAIAAAMDELATDSLVVLRLPSALAAAGIVTLTGLLARELGGGRRAQLIAAACSALAVIVLTTGHLLSTATFDLLAWTAVSWLVVRAIRTGQRWLWPLAGLAAGLGLLNKPLIAFLAAGLLAGVAIAGPRRLLRSPWVWFGTLIAFALWSPWLTWQAAHGWPQLEVSRVIAAGGSASSESRWAILPFQLLLVSPPLAPVWIAGLVRLFRQADMRPFRLVGWAWVLLAVLFVATGGKPYYLAGLLPALLGAGGVAVDGWLERGRRRLRGAMLASAFFVSAVVNTVIALPILPVDRIGLVVAVNEDVGETVGWTELVDTVASVRRSLPERERVVVFTRNYGQAGAIDRFGPERGLPHAYSGHNAYGLWGPPPEREGRVIVVGVRDASQLRREFRGCRFAARIGNRARVDNEEWGAPVWVCAGTRRPWRVLWPRLRRVG